MSITKLGIEGETLARKILKSNIKNLESMLQADWIYKQDGKYYLVEVKNKEMFKSPPFDGYGLNYSQIITRLDFYKDTGIRCLFLCICNENDCIYFEWLDKLFNLEMKDKIYLTKSKIMIFNLEKFKKASLNSLAIK